jgi:hypothetical protein
MRKLQRVLLLVLVSFPVVCRAEESCLWLNAATAGGVLGGAVAASVSHAVVNLPGTHTANAKSGAGPLSANASAASYSNNGMDDSDCVFSRQAPIAGELRIEVRTMNDASKDYASYAARCGDQATPLRAIGNEALACSLKDGAGRPVAQLVGRVRERSFVIRLSSNDPSMSASVLSEKLRKVADIIAGNLF